MAEAHAQGTTPNGTDPAPKKKTRRKKQGKTPPPSSDILLELRDETFAKALHFIRHGRLVNTAKGTLEIVDCSPSDMSNAVRILVATSMIDERNLGDELKSLLDGARDTKKDRAEAAPDADAA